VVIAFVYVGVYVIVFVCACESVDEIFKGIKTRKFAWHYIIDWGFCKTFWQKKIILSL
jgi:hypothetical protein